MTKKLENGMVLVTDGENSDRIDLERIARFLGGGWGLKAYIRQDRWNCGCVGRMESATDLNAYGYRYALISKQDGSSRLYVRRV